MSIKKSSLPMPVKVHGERDAIKKSLELAQQTTSLLLGKGPQYVLKVAKTERQSIKEQVKNVMNAVYRAVPLILHHDKKKFVGVKEVSIRTSNSLALTLFKN